MRLQWVATSHEELEARRGPFAVDGLYPGPSTSRRLDLVFDEASGAVLFDKDAHLPLPPTAVPSDAAGLDEAPATPVPPERPVAASEPAAVTPRKDPSR